MKMGYLVESFRKSCKEENWVKVVYATGTVMIGRKKHFKPCWVADNLCYSDMYSMMLYANSIGGRVYEY